LGFNISNGAAKAASSNAEMSASALNSFFLKYAKQTPYNSGVDKQNDLSMVSKRVTQRQYGSVL
jgi:hypothetical protein